MKFLAKLFSILVHRVFFVALMIILQFAFLTVMLLYFQEHFVYFYWLSIILALSIVLYIINSRSKPGYKVAWITLLLLVPIFGTFLYILLSGNRLSLRYLRKIQNIRIKQQAALPQNPELLTIMADSNPNAATQSRYIQNKADSPPYINTYSQYLPSGEAKFTHLLQELKKARRYIFLEYFIIHEGLMWDSILEILAEKAQAGLDIRLIYDDFGCIFSLSPRYRRKLESLGIKCIAFNRLKPIISSGMNNRDHRKIVVIDGKVGFTGGINLADEYINAVEKFGHWRDAAIMLKGEAVWSMTVMFLAMWDYLQGIEEDYNHFKPAENEVTENASGFVQPFSDSPLDFEAVGANVYLNLIGKANRYIYIQTPYLVLDDEMISALTLAAKSGIDVRIMMPHRPDKWYVLAVSRAYYEVLQEAGVKIYEYTPGFVHAKTFVADDLYAVVGTINLDYRSLYLHFECGCWLYNTESIADMRADFVRTLEQCQQISLAQSRSVPFLRRLGRALLRAFGPLM